VSFSPDGQRLATASMDTVKLWDAASGQLLSTLKGNQGLKSVSFSPDGQRLAAAGMDRTVKLWDAAGGQELRTLKGHDNMVVSVSFSSDGQRLASASWDGTVKLWDVAIWPMSPQAGIIMGPNPPPEELSQRRFMAAIDYHWHRGQADLLKNSDPFAAAFHLGWLLQLSPDDGKTLAEFLQAGQALVGKDKELHALAARGFQNRVTALTNTCKPGLDAAAAGQPPPGPQLAGAVVSLQELFALETAARKFAQLR
jgi:WD40 repeat protein